jgi:hypothetical protein
MFLSQLSLKISVFLQWAWLFLTGQRGSQLIVNYHASESIPTALPAVSSDRGSRPVTVTALSTK